MKTCVLIPTYNEANTIGELITQIRNYIPDVIIVDDGSSDSTGTVASKNLATVLTNEKNQGKGASLKKGFDYALVSGFGAVITMDGDGQHFTEDIPFFMRLAQYSNTGIIIGNRTLKIGNCPFVRLITNRFMSWLLSGITKQDIPDTQCGFRLIKKEVLEKVNLKTSHFETESEILLQASRLGFKIESVPVKTVYQGRSSYISPLVDTLRFIKLMMRQLWTSRP